MIKELMKKPIVCLSTNPNPPNNFKDIVKLKKNNPKPVEDFWVKFDRIIHLVIN
jgi:hypothetical protein